MYIVIAQYDSCDPAAWGTYKTYDEAKAKVDELRKNFDDYDHNHCTSLVVTKLK
jgi:hypothetical protein